MNDRRLNINPTYVFKTSMTALQIACEMNINSGHFMGQQQYAHFDGNEKRISKMTVLTLSIYHPLLRKQIPLRTMDRESENKESAELFWKMWIEALKEFNGEIKFDPIGIILDKKTCNCNAIEKYFGEDLSSGVFPVSFTSNKVLQED